MDIFLKVKITVLPSVAEQKSFLAEVGEFLKTGFMAERKWKLYGGFEITEDGYDIEDNGYVKKARPSTAVVENSASDGLQFLNVWQLPNGFAAGDIANIMLDLSDLGSYVQLDSHVNLEVQDLVARVNDPIVKEERRLLTAPKEGTFACVRHYVDRKRLAEFALSSGILARDWCAANDSWDFLGSFQNITGLLNVFWDIWHVPSGMKLKDFETALAELTHKSDAVTVSYRQSISADGKPLTASSSPADCHDGLVMLKPAPYWSLT